MTNRYPLVLDTSNSTNRIKELPANDNLYLRNNNIIDVRDIHSVGTIDAQNFTLNGTVLVPASLTDLTRGLADNPNKYVRVNSQGTGFSFNDQTGGQLSDFTNDVGYVTIEDVQNYVQDSILGSSVEQVTFINSDRTLVLSPETLTQNRSLTLPDTNGTIATREWVGTLTGSSEKSYNSVYKCSGSITAANITDGRFTKITNVEFVNNFRIGDKIRVYGANQTAGLTLSTNNVTFSVTKNGFSNIPSGNGVNVYYKIAKFNIENGNISPATTDEKFVIVDSTVEYDSANNVKIIITQGVDSTTGLLVYKKVGAEGAWRLIAVLASGNYANGTYIDYDTYDKNEWSGLNPNTNVYMSSNSIHFPLTPPSQFMYGWSDVTITSVDFAAKEITVDTPLFARQGTINISSNDTEMLQQLIQDQIASGRLSLKLSDVSYVVSKLTIPDNFSLIGISGMTTLHKLPWSGVAQDTNNLAILQSAKRTAPANIAIENLKINGNIPNQFLIADSTDDSANYAINFGTQGVNIRINNVDLYSVVGGGMYATAVESLTISNSRFKNGTISDRYLYSPAVIYNALKAVINENVFENFTSAVDVSVSRESVVSNNIIKNSGTGLLVYGSRNLVSSPNVLVGPANEFLPSPDILNSVYDSVNIYLEPDLPFTSDQYRYQENGENFNLKQNLSNNIIYELWQLEKTAEGAEKLYNKITNVSIVNIPGGNDPAQGEFQFRITKDMVNRILTDYDFATRRAARPTHVGLVYRAVQEEYVEAATIKNDENGVVGSGGTQGYPTNTYIVKVTNAKYLSIGSDVTFSGAGEFNAKNVSGVSILTGKVYDLDINPDNTGIVVVEFTGAVEITPGRGGVINIINRFVMAKGRVL